LVALWTVDDVAKRLAVPRTWIYKAAARGELPSIKLGKYLRFEPEQIEAWLAAQQRGGKER
jgi:excisionase family DNA binding protein